MQKTAMLQGTMNRTHIITGAACFILGAIASWTFCQFADTPPDKPASITASHELDHDVWVNTKWRARGRIHEPGCKWYGIGHGYMTRRPPAEAVHCKLCEKKTN